MKSAFRFTMIRGAKSPAAAPRRTVAFKRDMYQPHEYVLFLGPVSPPATSRRYPAALGSFSFIQNASVLVDSRTISRGTSGTRVPRSFLSFHLLFISPSSPWLVGQLPVSRGRCVECDTLHLTVRSGAKCKSARRTRLCGRPTTSSGISVEADASRE